MKFFNLFFSPVKKEQVQNMLLVLFLTSSTLGTRFLLYTFTPGFHEYESAFVYVSDLLLFLFLGRLWFSKKNIFPAVRKPVLVFFGFIVLFSIVSIFFAPSWLLALYVLVRLVLYMLFAIGIPALGKERGCVAYILAMIAVLAVIQAGIGIGQFAAQGNLGLSIFGESPISSFDPETSKSIIGDARIVRSYGTFPHPNVLGGFLVLGLGALYYLWFKVRLPVLYFARKGYAHAFKIYSPVIIKNIILSSFIFIVLTGIVLTFSRVSWVLAIFVSSVMFVYGLIVGGYRRHALKLFVVVVFSCWLLVVSLSPFIFPRARVSFTEPSVTSRISYLDIGKNIIQEHPFGVGLGNQVWYAVENNIYREAGFTIPQEWQPIHNVYVLMTSEIGIGGALSFIVFLITLLVGLLRVSSLESQVLATMLMSLLLFGLFDHFLWTLPQGQFMLWLVIGLTLLVSSTAREAPSDI